jgi:hypothetical protein
MAPRPLAIPSAAALLVLAGCGGADGSSRAVADLRSRVEAQSAEIDSMRREIGDLRAKTRLLEEGAAARPASDGTVAGAKPGVPGSAEAPSAGEETGAATVPPSPTEESVAAFLETTEGQKRLESAVAAYEKRRQEEAARERRERLKTMIEERVKGALTERLGLDSQQQQSLIRISTDAAERAEEIWSSLRDARNDPAAFAQVREKSQQIRTDAMTQVQQTLTVDQYNKFQEVMAEGGGMGFFGGGDRGRGFGGGGTPAPQGGAR